MPTVPSFLSGEIDRGLDEIGRITASIDPTVTTAVVQMTWKGTDYDLISAIEVDGNMFGAGGFAEDNNLTLTVKQSLFDDTDMPKPEQPVTFKSRKFIIDTVKTDTSSTSLILSCRSANRGAGIKEREM